jgi:hypothetical protein
MTVQHNTTQTAQDEDGEHNRDDPNKISRAMMPRAMSLLARSRMPWREQKTCELDQMDPGPITNPLVVRIVDNEGGTNVHDTIHYRAHPPVSKQALEAQSHAINPPWARKHE